MAETGISEYFYGDEAEQFIYFRIPRQLITDPSFQAPVHRRQAALRYAVRPYEPVRQERLV